MVEDSLVGDGLLAPRRHIDKHEAVRHLLHAAVRLIMKMEDPFAVHLIVHSADKLLIDLAAKRGQELRVDWELYIKKEYHDDFFERHRKTYNYLKHAKNDFADDLPVHDIMMLNVMTLFICVANYAKLFGEYTDHMTLFLVFVMNLSPAIVNPEPVAKAEIMKGLAMMQSMTPGRYFETFEQNAQMLPRFYKEVSKDLEDITDFYSLTFSQLRAGETKSTRSFRVPE